MHFPFRRPTVSLYLLIHLCPSCSTFISRGMFCFPSTLFIFISLFRCLKELRRSVPVNTRQRPHNGCVINCTLSRERILSLSRVTDTMSAIERGEGERERPKDFLKVFSSPPPPIHAHSARWSVSVITGKRECLSQVLFFCGVIYFSIYFL